ncbi:MAG TPA: tetratricopeptide repeat protein [Candidatus Acidoferrum sp.]|nr:tetratricopeptide repeat protein [Candidatus Acidoferrum sp.]
MNVTRRVARTAFIALLSLFCIAVVVVKGQDAGGAAGGQKYTMAEYNAYQAAAAEKNPAAQIKLLDDFLSKYPNSALLNYIYPLYYKNYGGQKNFPKTIEYCDKLIALGDKASPAEKYEAYSVRAYAYNNIQNPDAATATAARAAALAGVKAVDAVSKPDGVDEAKFNEQKKQSIIFFNGTAANAAMAAKDYPGAIESYKTVLSITPDDLTSNYSLGKAYMASNPPQQLDALWYFARAASSKNANAQQSTQVKTYLRKLVAAYQGGTVCDALTDAELNELLQLASTSTDRPASYKLYSSAELTAAQKDMTIASVVTDLKAGGDKAKLTWTASCGLEFPDVPGKIIEVTPGTESTQLKTAFVTSDAEFDAATTPNMDVKVVGQPDAAKLEKGNPVRFTGTLVSYDPEPAFMLHWDKAKVNEEDLPKDNKKPAAKKPAAKKPS